MRELTVREVLLENPHTGRTSREVATTKDHTFPGRHLDREFCGCRGQRVYGVAGDQWRLKSPAIKNRNQAYVILTVRIVMNQVMQIRCRREQQGASESKEDRREHCCPQDHAC